MHAYIYIYAFKYMYIYLYAALFWDDGFKRHLYRVAKTHRMPYVASDFPQKKH